MGDVKKITLDSIRANPVALRAVNTESEEYLGLVDSIRSQGLLTAISVREKKDPESGDLFYELIDGLHRFTASKDAGLSEIPAIVQDADDARSLEMQIVANIHKIETKPAEYSKQLRRMLALNPMMTESELAQKLGKSRKWIQDRLSLNKISNQTIIDLVNSGEINLSNAYALAKLPEEEQADWVTRAQTEEPQVFVAAANERAKEIRDARRKGRDASPPEFQPTAHMRKLKELKEELETSSAASAIVAQEGASSAEEGFAAGIKWALNLDKASVEAQQAKWEADQQAKAEARKKREAEKARKKAEKAAKAAEEAQQAAAEVEA